MSGENMNKEDERLVYNAYWNFIRLRVTHNGAGIGERAAFEQEVRAAITAARKGALERAAIYVDAVGSDWHDSGDYNEASCSVYLAKGIRALKVET